MTLKEANLNQTVKIVGVEKSSRLFAWLESAGFVEQETAKVLNFSIFKQTLLIEILGSVIAIKSSEAAKILVEATRATCKK